MRIVIAGDWRWPQYEEAFALGLRDAGHEVLPFEISRFFKGFLGKQQSAIPIIGPALIQLNRALIRFVSSAKPDIFLAWRSTHLLPSTIKAINAMGIVTASYNNDDPFGPAVHGNVPWHHHILWFWYLRSLKYYQRNFFYRQVNVTEAKQWGALYADVLMPYFIPWQDRPVALTKEEKARFSCDVVFVGHYEPDGRVQLFRALIEAGLHMRLFGDTYWTKDVLGDLSEYFGEIYPVYGQDYSKALCGAKMCLCFFSKLNRDTYTRRCFEIPACGRLLLCERSKDVEQMFIDGQEAVFFSSKEELVEKAKWLIEHPDELERIAEAGMRRVWIDGHDVKSRASEFIFSMVNK
jgi:spore maturation protein CgeB